MQNILNILLISIVSFGCSKKIQVSKFENDKYVNVKAFGAKGDGTTDDYQAITLAVNYALKQKVNIYLPKGVYMLSKYFPIRNPVLKNPILIDYKGLKILGDGENTIIKTKSQNGCDVFQLNAVKNLFLSNFTITADIDNPKPKSGSNAISITNGGEKISINKVFCFDLPYVDKGNYLDGGKAFSIQPANTKNAVTHISITNSKADNCAYGFGIDLHGDKYIQNQIGTVSVDSCQFNECIRGISMGASGNFSDIEDLEKVESIISIENSIISDCEYGLFLVRLNKLKITRNYIKSNNFEEYIGIVLNGVVNSNISNNKIECKIGITSSTTKTYSGRLIKSHNNNLANNKQ